MRSVLGCRAAIWSIFCLLSTTAPAAGQFNVYGDGKYGVAGCGLGSLIFGTKPGVVQIVAATFNDISGNQTFGITTGTSNCGTGIFKAEQVGFLDNNLASLKKESAQGHGDMVVAYATLLGCDTTSLSRFAQILQANHAAVFAGSTGEAVLESTAAMMVREPDLHGRCGKI